jgi:rhodanese-related sulfurtransferase
MCDGSELKPVSREWDFGKVQQGSSKQMVFFVRNTGLDELVINNVHSCCGYSVDNVSKWTLAPGEKAEIALTCDASKKTLGRDKRYITLLSNSKVNPHELIPIKADISAAPEGFLPKKRPAARDKPSVQNEESTSSISAHDLYARISAGRDIMILDIRQSEECSEKYISNSIRLPAASILNDEAYLRDMLRNIEKTTLIAVLDWDGSGSTPITSKLKGLGYNALNVEGGISSWERNGYPITYNN